MTDSAKNWLMTAVLILFVLVALAFAQHADAEPEVDQETADALHSRDWAARQVCNGRAFEWTDDKTLVCYREVKP